MAWLVMGRFNPRWGLVCGLLCLWGLLLGCQATPPAEVRWAAVVASDVEGGCTAPCWHSLRPGVSSEQAFLALVAASERRSFDDVRRSELRPEGIGYRWNDQPHDIYARVRIYQDQLESLVFRLHYNNVSLAHVLETYGPPTAYGASILGSEVYFVTLIFVYEEEGVVVKANYPIAFEQLEDIVPPCEFELDWQATAKVFDIYLVEPGPAEEMVRRDPIGSFNNPTHYPQVWTGDNPIPLTLCPSWRGS